MISHSLLTGLFEIGKLCALICRHPSLLSGRLFSPSDKSKKTITVNLLHFPFGMSTKQNIKVGIHGFTNHVFTKSPPFEERKLFSIQSGDPLKKCDILHGGHTYPYQIKNAIKLFGIVSSTIHLG